MKRIPNPHDAYFKAALSNLRTAQEFFKDHLPEEILTTANLKTLTLEPTSFVDPSLQSTLCDLLYSIELNRKKGYFYLLIEHKREPDKWVTLQLFGDIVEIMKRYQDELGELPVIWAVILYNGDRSYPYSTDIFTLFGDQEAVARTLFLKPFSLIDLNQIPDEVIKQRTQTGIMKWMHKYNLKRDFLLNLKEMLPLLKTLLRQKNRRNW